VDTVGSSVPQASKDVKIIVTLLALWPRIIFIIEAEKYGPRLLDEEGVASRIDEEHREGMGGRRETTLDRSEVPGNEEEASRVTA